MFGKNIARRRSTNLTMKGCLRGSSLQVQRMTNALLGLMLRFGFLLSVFLLSGLSRGTQGTHS